MSWAKQKEMTWLRLLEGPGDLVVIPLAPTMRSVTYHGQIYHRMANTQSSWHEDEDRGEHSERGGAYLWDGWRVSYAAGHDRPQT